MQLFICKLGGTTGFSTSDVKKWEMFDIPPDIPPIHWHLIVGEVAWFTFRTDIHKIN